MLVYLFAQLIFPGEEQFFTNVKQLTFEGENAEAYFSPSGQKIIFQYKGKGALYVKVDPSQLPRLEKSLRDAGYNEFVIRALSDGSRMVVVPTLVDSAEIGRVLSGINVLNTFVKGAYECDQMFIMDTSGFPLMMVSDGRGRTTCGWFITEDTVVYSSTRLHYDGKCPKNPLVHQYMKKGIYVWPLFNYDLFMKDLVSGRETLLVASDGYDAEAEGNAPDGTIVFTSSMDGDLELYTVNPFKGRKIPERITSYPGYDGGAMFSPSGRYIVFRANHLTDEKEIKEFRDLLSKGLVKPTHVEIYVYDTQTDSLWQVTKTDTNVANFAPYFLPSEKEIIFASNMHEPGGFSFELYIIGIDGSNLRRVTHSGGFNAFPMFTKDGKKLIWTSNRNGKDRREFNIFIADWIYEGE